MPSPSATTFTLVGFILPLLGIFLLYKVYSAYSGSRELMSNGKEVMAKLVDCQGQMEIGDEGQEYVYYGTFSYNDSTGRAYSFEDSGQYSQCPESLALVYDAKNPAKAMLKSISTTYIEPVIYMVLIFLFTIVPAIFMLINSMRAG